MNNNNLFSNGSIVEQSKGKVQVYLSHVYGWMCIGLLLTAFVAWYASTNMQVLEMIIKGRFVLLIAQIGIVFVLAGMINKLSAGVATALFMGYAVLMGLTLSVYTLIYTSESIASTFFITAGMFAALSAYGYTTKRDLTGFGSFLFLGLVGILIASVVNIFLASSPLMWAITFIGVFIFAGLTAYDTQKLKEFGDQLAESNATETEFRRHAINGALTLYLDFINLFIMLLRLLGDRR